MVPLKLTIRTRVSRMLMVVAAVVGVAAQSRRASAQFGPAEALSVINGVKGAYSAWNDLQSIINGTDVSVASLIDSARAAIIAEIHGVVETAVEDDIEASIRNWFEITQTLMAFPANNNAIMQGRISNLLDATQLDWVTLRNIILTSKDVNLVYKALPAFVLVSALRTTVMKAMGQLNPPMPVAQVAIDQIAIDTMTTDYAVVGARIISFSGDPRVVLPSTHLHALYTNRKKILFPRFFSTAQYTCQYYCEPYVVWFGGAMSSGYCNFSHLSSVSSCTGSHCSDGCGSPYDGVNGCSGPMFPDGLTFFVESEATNILRGSAGTWVRNTSCSDNGGRATYDLMSNDPVVMTVRESLKAIIGLGQTGPVWQPKFYTVEDPSFTGTNPAFPVYLLPVPGSGPDPSPI